MTSALLFVSGFAALVYQVLWMRDLAVLFGNSSHAAAVALAVFFGGLAAGAGLFARASPRIERPLRAYGLLELGVGASALLFLILLDAYGWVYAPLHRRFAGSLPLLIGFKTALAAGVLALPTIFMGASLPAMIHHKGESAWLYGMNTAGAALGAFAAGFYLPPVLGFRGSYMMAVGLSVAAGGVALALSRIESAPARPSGSRARQRRGAAEETSTLPGAIVSSVAFASGVLTIALEVVWLRMFAQVLDNSVYAFSAVLVVALLAFALAAFVVSRLPPHVDAAAPLALMLALAGGAAAVQAPLFVALTNDLAPLSSRDWLAYLGRVFAMAGLFAGGCGFVAGLVFPLLLRIALRTAPPGAAAGRLLMLNTAGAIGGALLTTFVVLTWLGLWRTCAAIALAYAALSVWAASYAPRRQHRRAALAAFAGTVAAAAVLGTLPRVRLDAGRGERVLELWESSHGTVAVTETQDGRLLRLNNSYSLGGTTDRIERERIQTLIPLLLHPQPDRVFFLGLGTGITAGEALRHPVDRVVVAELIPEVVRAAHAHFGTWTRGLSSDPRVDIRAEDGRQYLASSAETFDVIVSDLFVPWHAGTGMLYSLEHFRTAASRLGPGGLFAQWLPLFQLNQRDFELIARTMQAVFPHVVVWRGDFYANRPILGLIGSMAPMQVDGAQLVSRARPLAPGADRQALLAAVLPFYAGNLGEARQLTNGGPLNTDDRPLIEFLAPRTQWDSDADGWFVSLRLVRFLDRLRGAAPVERDPYLARLSRAERGYVEAGDFYYRAIVERLRDREDEAMTNLARALERLPADVQVTGPFMALAPLVQ